MASHYKIMKPFCKITGPHNPNLKPRPEEELHEVTFLLTPTDRKGTKHLEYPLIICGECEYTADCICKRRTVCVLGVPVVFKDAPADTKPKHYPESWETTCYAKEERKELSNVSSYSTDLE